MNAWVVHQPGPIDSGPLQRLERGVPVPLGRQVRVQITCCGVCRTDLHLAEGDLLPKHADVTPGHEVVGIVDALGERLEAVAGLHRQVAALGVRAPLPAHGAVPVALGRSELPPERQVNSVGWSQAD